MKFLIAGILAAWSLLLTVGTFFSLYYAVTDRWSWAFVAAGLAMTAIVSWLTTSAAFDAVRHW